MHRRIVLALGMAALLAFIQANSEPFTTMDLPAIVDDRGKEAFIVRLVEEGILTVA